MRTGVCAVLVLVALTAGADERPSWVGLSFSYPGRWLQLCAVAPDGPAARAGLRYGDLSTQVDGKPVAFANDVAVLRYFAGLRPHRGLKLRVARGERTFDAVLVPLPMTDEQLRSYQRNLEIASGK